MTKEELKVIIGKARSYAKEDWRTDENPSKGYTWLCFQLLDYINDALCTGDIEKDIEKYIESTFESQGLSRYGGWADGLGCEDIEKIIRGAINFGRSLRT